MSTLIPQTNARTTRRFAKLDRLEWRQQPPCVTLTVVTVTPQSAEDTT